MTIEEKREYLELYPLQLAAIERFNNLAGINTDKREKYIQKIHSAIILRDLIEEDIEKIDDRREREVLAQKYLCLKTLEQTAEILNYSKRQIERIHTTALENLNPTIKELYKNGEGNTSLRS